MLAYVLALVIGLGSLGMYLAGFFLPEVHRKEDFIWSGIGLFYALVLWVCAGRITGGVLLGQTASVALLGWFGWQTLTLRRELTSPERRTPISPEVQEKIKGFSFTGLGQKLQQQVSGLQKKQPSAAPSSSASPTTANTPKDKNKATGGQATTQVPETAPAPTDTADTPNSSKVVTIIDSRNTSTEIAIQENATTEVSPSPTPVDEPAADNAEMSASPELVRPNPPAPERVKAAQESAMSNTADSGVDAATPIEDIAPEVELAPPAEPPGDGDPMMRQNPPDGDIAIEGVPIDPENPPTLS
ncbi:Ycf66 family protein [Allocoleopsis franciscana]|uniref:Ycf66 protein n=1 Tax=Allocoleopsis franciscana PCC 7113 TaxID=1173027 RepID=K9WIA8_9CYAN|nr:Ycf66 family protein [Allocoleopsis franciscana]AFZ19257.1 Ycf66 protein [Allocoleopsis franciscana PCC 7113]